MSRDLDDERRLLDISRWQREALEPPKPVPVRDPVDWDDVGALILATMVLAPYLGYAILVHLNVV